MNTGEAVLAYLQAYSLKRERDGYRCNSPLRPGSNSHGFFLKVDADGEHGVWTDHAGGESGTLYELADRLKIARPQAETERPPVADSLHEYKNLKEYAAFKGVGEEVFLKARWTAEPVTYDSRPALMFPTANGKRYRFVDGQKPKFKSQKNFKACWYGLKTATELAREHNWPLVFCNGEPSVIVATHYQIPACTIAGGEQPTMPAALLDELKATWTGKIIIALDCDEAGRKSAVGKVGILRAAGYDAVSVDLGLGNKGDLADYCKLYTDGVMAALLKLEQTAPAAAKTAPKKEGKPIPVVKRAERLSTYIDRVNDFDTPREAVAVPFPLSVLHSLGGMCRAMKPGKMVGIVGVSGGGKTSLIETMLDLLLPHGVASLVWSPEWTPDEFVERAVQRYGGPRMDDLYLHEIFIDEHQRGVEHGFGKELTASQKQDASRAIALLRQNQTHIGYLDMPLLTVSHLQESIESTLAGLDFKPHVLALDYAQLLAALEPGNVQMYDLLMRVKSVATSFGLIPMVATQVTKTSAKGQTKGKTLDALDARYVNDDAFNLFITINPDRDPLGQFMPSAVLNVAKNSLGEKGKVRIPANWDRLFFQDVLHSNQNFDDEQPVTADEEIAF